MSSKAKYTKDEVLKKLQKLYKETQKPITCTDVEYNKLMPSRSVFNRLFGSLESACKEANIPFEKRKRDMTDKKMSETRQLKVGETNINKQGCLMKIVEYHSFRNIIVEFQDDFLYRTKTTYNRFKDGSTRNPFAAEHCGVGVFGNKYPSKINGKATKECSTWDLMLRRCYARDKKDDLSAYDGVTCCKDWLYFPNFYEWLHSQENFDEWSKLRLSALDKDVLVKNNKVYSPDTCLLVPPCINSLFVKNNNGSGNYLPGVQPIKNSPNFQAACHGPDLNRIYLGTYKTQEEAFRAYKQYKEQVIKEIAEREYQKGTISKRCYDAMMQYQIEITD